MDNTKLRDIETFRQENPGALVLSSVWNNNFNKIHDVINENNLTVAKNFDNIESRTIPSEALEVLGESSDSNIMEQLILISTILTNKADSTDVENEMNNFYNDIQYDRATGTFTFTKKDGTVFEVDTLLEKVPVSMELISTETDVLLRVTNDDGSYTETSVSDLVSDYTFISGDTIVCTVTSKETSLNLYEVSFQIKAGSITEKYLDPSILSVIKEAVINVTSLTEAAKSAANNAKASETKALEYKNSAHEDAIQTSNDASNSATNALFSKSYSDGGTGVRENENYDNAKYYMQSAQSYASSAEQSKINAEKSANKAATSENNASAYSIQAQNSASNAAISESNAATSMESAATSESNAANSEVNAKTAETTAIQNAESSSNSADSAAKSAANALLSENNSKDSENNAANSESNAKTYADSAKVSEEIAVQSAESASNDATSASESASSASQSSSSASTSAASALASANTAQQNATTASTSASNALASENAAKEAQAAAEKARDEASAIVGGDFATNDEVREYIDEHNASSTAHNDIRLLIDEVVDNHTSNADIHVTSEDKTKWNSSVSKEYVDSSINEAINGAIAASY